MPVCPTCLQHAAAPMRFCPHDGAALVADPTAALVGQTVLGGYRIEAVAGQGATGVVYRARDVRMGRRVAVKVLHRRLAGSPAMRKRFQREARAVARITHPNIVGILDMGEVDGQPALVMDLVNGRSLDEMLREGRLTAERAVRIARQVASALAETHARGVVHRDLKPANLMIRATECGSESVTVLDFGVAKLVSGAMLEPDASQLTRDGEIFGTPSYIAPEQAHGEGVDARADIYSLGVVMYELLTGAVPFRGSAVTVLLGHLNREPDPPRAVDPTVDSRLEAIVMRCLRKRPEDRFASASALVDALDGWLHAQSTEPADSLHSTSWPSAAADPEASEFVYRRRRPLLGLLGMAFLVALGVAGERYGHRYYGHRHDAARGATAAVSAAPTALPPAQRPAAADLSRSAAGPPPAASTPRRAVVVAQAGYSVRVLLPERLAPSVSYEILLDAWDPKGSALEAPEVIVTIDRPDGSSRAVAAKPTREAGRYRFRRAFSQEGTYRLRVFPPAGDATIRLFFEVGNSPGA